MKSKKLKKVLVMRVVAAVSVFAAVALVMFVARPSSNSKAEAEGALAAAEGQLSTLESIYEEYATSGLSAEEFVSAVAKLDAQLPYNASRPACMAVVEEFAPLNPLNIETSLVTAMRAEGIEVDLSDLNSPEFIEAEAGSTVSAYAVSVSFTSTPTTLNNILASLSTAGFLVTADTLSVEVVEELTTTSARLLFWYSSVEPYGFRDLVTELCG